MLSIIVSSCDERQLKNFGESVKQTIGVEHEVIVIENKGAKYGLTEAYNLGASKARYPFFLFVHEDVLFKTPGWGRILIEYFETLESVGVLGVAGTNYKPLVPSRWEFGRSATESYSMLQSYKYRDAKPILTTSNHESVRQMLWLDGVFLAVPKVVFESYPFDENIAGFHGYDVDFCLGVSQQHLNYFVPGILIEHLSEGKFDDEWLKNAIQIYEKWKAKLPRGVRGDEVDLECELSAYYSFLNLLFESSLPVKTKFGNWRKITSHAIRKTGSTKFLNVLYHSFKDFRRKRVEEPTNR